MSTERDRTSENSHHDLGSAEDPQRIGAPDQLWPDRVVPSWSVPPGLMSPQVAACDPEPPEASQVPAQAEPASRDDDFPGVAPAAGWFLRSPDGIPQSAGPDDNVTGEWFASPAPEPGESPISWYQDTGEPEPEAAPPAQAAEEPARAAEEPAQAAEEPAPAGEEPAEDAPGPASGTNGSAPVSPGPHRRSVLAAEPV